MLGPFFLKPPIDIFLVSNGNYGSFLEARLRDLIFCIFSPFLGGWRGQKLIFFNCGIYYHVIPQNVLLFFQKNNEWVYQVRFFNLTLSAGVVSVVCLCVCRVLPLGLSFWKHLQSCSCGQMVTMGYISDHAEGFFKIFIFTPFLGEKQSKMAQKWHFCTKCWGLFSWSHL